MADGSFDLQGAVFSALSGLSPPLTDVGLYSPAPENAPLPYIEIGESDTIAADIEGRDGLTETLTLHVWTKTGSYGPAKQIISRIRGALHAKNLTVSGRSAALAVVGSTRIFTDQDGESIHGVVTLTVNHFGLEEV